eukprot:scaffold16721_cov36-Attheya_sp.AAC.2
MASSVGSNSGLFVAIQVFSLFLVSPSFLSHCVRDRVAGLFGELVGEFFGGGFISEIVGGLVGDLLVVSLLDSVVNSLLVSLVGSLVDSLVNSLVDSLVDSLSVSLVGTLVASLLVSSLVSLFYCRTRCCWTRCGIPLSGVVFLPLVAYCQVFCSGFEDELVMPWSCVLL